MNMNLSQLTMWYQEWLASEKLPQMSADELLRSALFSDEDIIVSHDQKIVLNSFIEVWNEMMENPNISIMESFQLWMTKNKLTKDQLNHPNLLDSQKKIIDSYKNIMFMTNLPN